MVSILFPVLTYQSHCFNLHPFLLTPALSFYIPLAVFCLSVPATSDHLLTLAFPCPATLAYFSVIFHLRMLCHSISILTAREAPIMLPLKCTFPIKSFLIPTIRIKICPLCGPSKFPGTQVCLEAFMQVMSTYLTRIYAS